MVQVVKFTLFICGFFFELIARGSRVNFVLKCIKSKMSFLNIYLPGCLGVNVGNALCRMSSLKLAQLAQMC